MTRVRADPCAGSVKGASWSSGPGLERVSKRIAFRFGRRRPCVAGGASSPFWESAEEVSSRDGTEAQRVQACDGGDRNCPVRMSSTTKPTLKLPGWLHDLLDRHLQENVELPILPEASARIMSMCEDEKTDAKAIEGVLERDPSLASHVLRIANSSAYAPKEPIVSLQQAVSRLGLATMRNIVLGVSLQGRVFKVPGHQARVRAIWIHCAVTAAFAREVARKLRRNVEAAFLCGLLHDVGRPVVLQATVEALAHRTKETLPVALLETAMNEFHEEVAGRMVAEWKLAAWTVAVVAHHHEPEKAQPYEEEARITLLADLLSYWALDDSRTVEDFVTTHPVIDALNLYPEDVDALLAYRGKALEFAEAFQ